MSNTYYNNLIKTVLDASESKSWQSAVKEWIIFDCEEDEFLGASCVCGKERLRYLYTIKNIKKNNTIFPIGSTCIEKFDRDDFEFELSVYRDMFKLLHSVKLKKYIELNAKYFSRNLLLYLYENDAFKPNEYNDYDAENDYLFMLDLFNKRNKEEISESQIKKTKAIIVNDIIPFMKQKIKIRNYDSVDKNGNLKCPKCGANMVLRKAKNGYTPGKEFWGCSAFPKCRCIINLEP